MTCKRCFPLHVVLLMLFSTAQSPSATAQTTCPAACEDFANPPAGRYSSSTSFTLAVFADDAMNTSNRFDDASGRLAGCIDGEQRGYAGASVINGRAYYFLSVQGDDGDLGKDITFRYCLGQPGDAVGEAVPFGNDNNASVFDSQGGYGSLSVPYRVQVSSAVLPVELSSFVGVASGSGVRLSWETSSETNNAGFAVEWLPADEPADAGWAEVAWVEGHGTTTIAQRYSHQVDDLRAGRHLFRLEQHDFDGSVSYSTEVEVVVDPTGRFQLSQPHPQPFTHQTQFSLVVSRRQHVRVDVFDVLGKNVAALHDGTMEAGTTRTFTFEGGALPSGLYLVRAAGESFTAMRRVVLAR